MESPATEDYFNLLQRLLLFIRYPEINLIQKKPYAIFPFRVQVSTGGMCLEIVISFWKICRIVS